MKYHDPQLFIFLSKHGITAEMFTIPSFLTIFSSKLSLEMTYILWEIFILIDDPNMIFFICISLLLLNKNKIIKIESS